MIKKMVMVATLAFTLFTAAHADLLVDFATNANYVTANLNNQGLTAATNPFPRYVPFSMTEVRSPATGYTGPVFFGGVTGNVAITTWLTQNSTPDYISAGSTTTNVGSKVTGLIMLTNNLPAGQSATITQVLWSIRMGGTAAYQTNLVAFVVRKDSGAFYISETMSQASSGIRTNSNPGALAWYNYDPTVSLTDRGSLVSGFALDSVNAVGEWQDATIKTGSTYGVGINAFQVWGTTVASKDIQVSSGSLNVTEGTTNSFQVRLSSQPDASITVNVSRVSGSTNLVVLPASASAVFATTNWSVYQSIYIEALTDSDTNSETATITCTDPGSIYSAVNVSATQIDTTLPPAVPPTALFSATPTIGYAPLLVSFTDTSTGTITNRSWDFGDGTTTNITGTNVTHTYTAGGTTNSVQLAVSGPAGASSSNLTVTILSGTPTSLPIYDSFSDSVSTSAIPAGWLCLAPGINASHSRIDAGSLAYTGLQASAGNSWGLGAKTDDYSQDFASPNLGTNETVYFSTLFRMNNAPATNIASGAIRLYDLTDEFGSGVEIGFGMTNSGGDLSFSLDTRNRIWSSATLKTPANNTAIGVTYLIVASYTRGTTATNGLTQLWINPDSSTFGTATPPAATLTTNTYASDANWNRLQVLSAGSASWPTNWQLDEIRVSTNWAEVVPAAGAVSSYTLTVNSGSGGGSYTNGHVQAISADVIGGKTFVAWTGDTVYLADSNSASTTVTMPAQAVSVTATYVDTTYALTVTSGSGGGSYTNGHVQAISADVIGGKTFVAWTGDTVYLADSNSASTTVTMPAQAVSVTATYVDTTYALTVTSGSGGGSYTNGHQVAIAANAPASGYAFSQWTGDTVYLADSNSASTTVTMPAQAVAVTATYIATEQYTTNAIPVPYSWLAGYGITNNQNAAVLLDPDGDGLTTEQEYIANTDPTNAASVLKAAQANRNVITWAAQSNRIYSVYWATNLVQGFTALSTNVVAPQGSYTNTTPDGRVNHYQIKVRLP